MSVGPGLLQMQQEECNTMNCNFSLLLRKYNSRRKYYCEIFKYMYIDSRILSNDLCKSKKRIKVLQYYQNVNTFIIWKICAISDINTDSLQTVFLTCLILRFFDAQNIAESRNIQIASVK